MQMFNMINGQPAGSRYFDADCGSHFNNYVKRTRTVDFEYCPMQGGCTTHDNLWKGRRLRIKMDPSPDATWREAKVVEWDEYLMGPFAPKARWDITIEFTDIVGEDEDQDNGDGAPRFDLGDVVEIHGLENAKQHNEKVGLIQKRAGERYAVQYEDHKVAVKPSNLKRLEFLELNVHRCNIEGGGVLEIRGVSHRISFEWLDEANPKIDLSKEPWEIVCPSCREVSKSDAWDADASTETTASECPICLETKECTRLPSCTHQVCSSCLTKCRKKIDGTSFFGVEDVTVDLSEEEISKQLEENSKAVPKNRCTREHAQEITGMFQELGEMAQDGDMDGLKLFKQWLLTHPLDLWCPSAFLNYLNRCIGVEAAEILFDYMRTIRDTDAYRRFVVDVMKDTKKYGNGAGFRLCGFVEEGDDFMTDPSNHFSIQMIQLTEAIGVKYEERGEFYSAICWYEKNIEYVPETSNLPNGQKRILSNSVGNLGLAQKRAGLYQTALETYNRALETNPSGESLIHNKGMLLEEIEEWKGSSGYVTPRLDE